MPACAGRRTRSPNVSGVVAHVWSCGQVTGPELCSVCRERRARTHLLDRLDVGRLDLVAERLHHVLELDNFLRRCVGPKSEDGCGG